MSQTRYIQASLGTGAELRDYTDHERKELSTFGPISRLNLLVGPTNSGKSRFLRGLARTEQYAQVADRSTGKHLARILSACDEISESHLEALVHYGRQNVRSLLNSTHSKWSMPELGQPRRDQMLSQRWAPVTFDGIRDSLGKATTATDEETRINAQEILSNVVDQFP